MKIGSVMKNGSRKNYVEMYQKWALLWVKKASSGDEPKVSGLSAPRSYRNGGVFFCSFTLIMIEFWKNVKLPDKLKSKDMTGGSVCPKRILGQRKTPRGFPAAFTSISTGYMITRQALVD